MDMQYQNRHEYIFETGWEVCNKVGGIYTVLSTKAKTMVKLYGNKFIAIGPDLLAQNSENGEFMEMPDLLGSWQLYAKQKGLSIRVGKWNIEGNPIVILVNFTPYFSEKDKLFGEFWEQYHLDSITGQWDYIEPFLFGYAAAKVIENYYEYFLSSQDRIVAHFHEWMTGSGILYLKKHVPQAATVFTTHATVLGRCIAGNGLPLYNDLDGYQGEYLADTFQVRSKYSLEKLSALHADGFSTVSEITNKECTQFFGKEVNVVTPNGFENDFVPQGTEYTKRRISARKKILTVGSALLGEKLDENSLLVINSGRYEFKNKGMDVFIEALGKLNHSKLDKTVLAVIAVPAGHDNVNELLLEHLHSGNYSQPTGEYTTHRLHDHNNDPVVKALREAQLLNRSQDKVKVMFIPSYLDGKDGLFNLTYFDFLIGFDFSVFPSYYEPWGYTPMESIAFGIPTITTSLAGFGLWIKEKAEKHTFCISVLERNDEKTEQLRDGIVDVLTKAATLSETTFQKLKQEAQELSKHILWSQLIGCYSKLYDYALKQSENRFDAYRTKKPQILSEKNQFQWGTHPEWKKVFVRQTIPNALKPLMELSQNLWWSWNYEAIRLFESINIDKLREYEYNPINLIHSLLPQDWNRLIENADFMKQMNDVWHSFQSYMKEAELRKQQKMVAYFSMEYGIHDSLKIFSGGLGMLAGDYLKEASDVNKNMVGIGLLYRYGYFTQHINLKGEQTNQYYSQEFSKLPLIAVRDENGKWQKVQIPMPGRMLHAKIWRCDVGRVPLYLLDTDIEENREDDRTITHQLYGGGHENRIKQEILLGFGGVQLLEMLNLKPDVFHLNEGHASFIVLARMARFVKLKISYTQAKEIVRSSTLYTTHTPVPAGHDSFSEELVRMYLSNIPNEIGIAEWEEFMELGKMPGEEQKFSMSALAMNFSQEVNGVSRIHGRVSREMFANLYPGYFPEELHVDYVTNGVHFPTWVSENFLKLYIKHFGKAFLTDLSNAEHWNKIYQAEDHEIWNAHQQNKEQLFELISHRVKNDLIARAENPRLQFEILNRFSPKALTVGFARRFATYKRAHLLFSDLDRLDKLVNNESYPLQFVFAGKAHPNDKAGRDLIQRIVEISKQPAFVGKIIFLENYDMYLAKHLVRGVDVWLNTPTRPLEASGTSGEKAIMNGVLNFSVLDGWWAEGWKKDAGWMLPEKRSYENQQYQDALDAQMIYEIFEDEIIPAYYDRDKNGVSSKWVGYMENTIAKIAPHFTMKRQLDDYYRKFYDTLFVRAEKITANNGDEAKEYALWKLKMQRDWNSITLLDVQYPNSTVKPLNLGEKFDASVLLDLNDIDPEHLGVELVFIQPDLSRKPHFKKTFPLQIREYQNNKALYAAHIPTDFSGVYEFAFRLYPKHPMMPHRMDFPLVKWI